ncbi:DUF3048 domain-containing protein [Trujillonella humicola]|uniref:DUF3048 domain-containing protein n=1 Tax=Trujillonella humicola TaxID=3383699 RepID=UPI0039067019
MATGFLLSVAVACVSDGDPDPAPSSATPPGVWPLTGVDAAGDDTARPALAVKVENSAAARPQTGLNAADVVWEEVVEGGISRYVAVYHSTVPPAVGPVRSVRPMDAPIAAPLRGLFAYTGGQAPFVEAVRAAGLQDVSADSGADGYYRAPGREAPHNTYVDPAALLAQADDAHRDPPPQQFAFAAEPTAPAEGTPAAGLDLALSPVAEPQWDWSAEEAAWLRSEGSAPAVDSDGVRLRATNVVVLRVDVVDTEFTDSIGNPVPETVVVGEGEALVATGGHSVEASWSKASVGEPVVLTLADGSPVTLAPGTTWVELVPNRTGSVATG